MTPLRTLAAAALLLAAPSAQTFVVDANGGGQFTSIDAALASVPSGAVLNVLAGTYPPFVIDGVSVTVFANPGVTVTGTCAIQNIATDQSVTLSGVTFADVTPGESWILIVDDCAGSVVLDDITTPSSLDAVPIIFPIFYYPTALTLRDSERVVVRSSVIGHVDVIASRATFEGSSLTGSDGIVTSPTEALYVIDGDVDLVGCSLIGGSAPVPETAGAGLLGTLGSTIDVRSGSIRCGGGVPSFAVFAPSSATRIDPGVSLVGGAQPVWPAPTIVDLPEVTSASGQSGAWMIANVRATAGDLVALFAGVPGTPWSLPGVDDLLWIEPASLVIENVFVQPVGAFPHVLQIPPLPSLAGTPVAWQALTLAGADLRASNASVSLVR